MINLKNTGLLTLYIFAFVSVHSQQSTTGKIKPGNTDNGIIDNSSKEAVVISDAPSYLWRHGCGPTALGMVIGYYDMFGFNDLIPGDASVQTTDVNNSIANSDHYDDYSLPIDNYPDLFQDKSELGGAHGSNCIADFMKTSWSLVSNRYGWSWSSHIANAFTGYIQYMNPDYSVYTVYEWFSGSSWELYKEQIDAGKPVVLLVDSDGDGATDHFVTGIGYDDENSLYAIYDTWDNSIHWYEWREMSDQYSWGIYGFNILHVQFTITADVLPENSGTVSGTGTFDFEETVELSAQAETGFVFLNWTNEGSVVSTDQIYVFNANENLDLTANFTAVSSTEEQGIEDIVKIYPNPANEFTDILLKPSDIKNVQIHLFNSYGSELKEIRSQRYGNGIRLCTFELKNGIYYIKISLPEGKHILKKIIISK